jgi:hypothetical protein
MKKIFILTAIFFGAFLLFYPQTSRAISCKCTVTLSTATKNFRCVYMHPAVEGKYFSDCEQFKTALISPNDPNSHNDIAVRAVLVASEFNTADVTGLSSSNVACAAFSDEQCLTPFVAPVSPVEQLKQDLTARKPVLEVNIPGLNLNDVKSVTDDTGTYVYIPWISQLITALYKFGLGIVSIVAVVVIIIQGLRVITSGGGEGKTVAYKKILQSIVGLFIAWGSYALLYNINPALVQFNALKVKVVEKKTLADALSQEEGAGLPTGSANTAGSGADTKWLIPPNGTYPGCDPNRYRQVLQQPAVCPFTTRLSSPLQTGQVVCNYHIFNAKNAFGADYDINATYNLDLPAQVQTFIYSPIDGVATYSNNPSCGNNIEMTFVADNKTYKISMCHLYDSTLASQKDKPVKVVRGQVLGRTGGAMCIGQTVKYAGMTVAGKFEPPLCQTGAETGLSAGPHLHIGTRGTFPLIPCMAQ